MDKEIEVLVKMAQIEYSRHGKYRKLDKILQKLQALCPHDKGRGIPSYWNDGSAYCNICGNDKQGYWNDNL